MAKFEDLFRERLEVELHELRQKTLDFDKIRSKQVVKKNG